jgi:hypothetical protein
VGLCLLRYDPRQNDWFPSLFAAGRMGRPKKRRDNGDSQEEDGEDQGPYG